jgi:hypothetical protein
MLTDRWLSSGKDDLQVADKLWASCFTQAHAGIQNPSLEFKCYHEEAIFPWLELQLTIVAEHMRSKRKNKGQKL